MLKEYIAPILLALAAAAHAGELDGTHPLSASSRQAAQACQAIDAFTIDYCANRIGRGPAFTAARRAVATLYSEHEAFLRKCKEPDAYCELRAEALVQTGFNLAPVIE